jgi:glycosyltransferase involved in cell wall biosynthesis
MNAPRPPRLLFASTTSVFLRTFLLPFARHYRARGWEVEALAAGATTDGDLADAFDAVHDASWGRQPLAPGNLDAARQVRALVDRRGFDIVHVHTPVAAFVTRLALRDRVRGRPHVVYTAHGFHFHRGGGALRNAAYAALERLGARWTDDLVVINEEDERTARTMRLLPAERLHRMHGIGVDVAHYAPTAVPAAAVAAVRAAIGLAPSDPMIVHVAEFTANKRQLDLVEALARDPDGRWHAVFVGDGPLRATVGARAAALGVAARTHFVGQVRDPRPWMRAAAGVVLVSEREGLPRSVLEAVALEVPVIGTAIRGTGELLAEGRGHLVPVADPAALATAIAAVLDAPEAAARRALDAARYVRSRYSLSAAIAAHDALYEAALRSAVSLPAR